MYRGARIVAFFYSQTRQLIPRQDAGRNTGKLVIDDNGFEKTSVISMRERRRPPKRLLVGPTIMPISAALAT